MHTYIHTYVCTYIHTYIYKCIFAKFTHLHAEICIRWIYICAFLRVYIMYVYIYAVITSCTYCRPYAYASNYI